MAVQNWTQKLPLGFNPWPKCIGGGALNALAGNYQTGLTVAQHTLQTYLARVRLDQPASPTRAIFLKNPARVIWACDFLPIIDLWFRPLYLLFIIELASRQVVHFGVTRSPTDARVAQQLREATALGRAPRFLIRDRDSK